jgi:hypothetical protein
VLAGAPTGRGGGAFTGAPAAVGLTGAEGLSAAGLIGVFAFALVGVAGAGFDITGLTGTAGLTADGLTMLGLTGAGSAGLAVAA